MEKKYVRKFAFVVAVIIVVILLCVAQSIIANKAADNRYQHIHSTFLSCVPVEDHNYLNMYFYRGEESDYLYFKVNNKVILGMRDHNSGEASYFVDGLCFDQNGIVQETNLSGDSICDALDQALTVYLMDEGTTYAFHKPSGRDLPLGVSPLDTGYYLISRAGHDECVEAISYCTDDHIRWTEIRTDGDIIFYMVLAEENKFSEGNIPGWGSVPQDIMG